MTPRASVLVAGGAEIGVGVLSRPVGSGSVIDSSSLLWNPLIKHSPKRIVAERSSLQSQLEGFGS